MTTSQRIKRIASTIRVASKQFLYHGTNIKNLRKILKEDVIDSDKNKGNRIVIVEPDLGVFTQEVKRPHCFVKTAVVDDLIGRNKNRKLLYRHVDDKTKKKLVEWWTTANDVSAKIHKALKSLPSYRSYSGKAEDVERSKFKDTFDALKKEFPDLKKNHFAKGYLADETQKVSVGGMSFTMSTGLDFKEYLLAVVLSKVKKIPLTIEVGGKKRFWLF